MGEEDHSSGMRKLAKSDVKHRSVNAGSEVVCLQDNGHVQVSGMAVTSQAASIGSVLGVFLFRLFEESEVVG